jgi:hypothetical protein
MARLLVLAALAALAHAQPNPQVQKNITAAITAAGAAKNTVNPVDYTKFVNPFIGTGAFLLVRLCAHI